MTEGEWGPFLSMRVASVQNQTTDYYSSHKAQLLERFEEHCDLVSGSLRARYGDELASALRSPLHILSDALP